MATKKKDNEIGVKLLGIGLAASGGFISTFGMTQAELKVPAFEKNPALAPLLNAFVGGLLVFVTPKTVQPLGYGMLGASGGDGANMLVNGLSRVEVETDVLEGTMKDNEELIEELSAENEAIQEVADEIEEAFLIDEDDGTS